MIKTRQFPKSLTRHSYWLAAMLPLMMPLSWSLRDVAGFSWIFAWLPLLVLYVLIPLLDVVIGRDLSNPEVRQRSFYPDDFIPIAAGVCHLAVLAWAVALVPELLAQYGWVALVGWVLSMGDTSATVGINVAHELIHRRDRAQRVLGGLMLASVWYGGFKLEHTRWHHVHVSTPNDPSSAARGDTVYGQVPRAMWLNTIQAWRLGKAAAEKRGRALPWLSHEVMGWCLISLLMTVLAGLTWGGLAAVAFVLQGVLAAALLEVINYVEHYGLRREMREDGRYVPPGVTHSWDCDYWLSNAILIQLPRHADHHTHPSRAFNQLQLNEPSPVLPYGYPLLVLVAMIPPLWRRIIHPHLPTAEASNPVVSG